MSIELWAEEMNIECHKLATFRDALAAAAYTNNFETEGLASHRWACLRQIYIGRRRKRTLIPCCPKHLNLGRNLLCAAVADTGGNIIILPSVASMSRFRCLGQHMQQLPRFIRSHSFLTSETRPCKAHRKVKMRLPIVLLHT
jgi:hypothetical protein